MRSQSLLYPLIAIAVCAVFLPAHGADSFRRDKLEVKRSNRVGFSLLTAPETGIQFTNVLDQNRYTTNQIYLNGSGVAAGDVDGDGRCDLFFSAVSGGSALYR